MSNIIRSVTKAQNIQIVFDTEFPPELIEKLNPLLEKWSFLIPDWVYYVYLFFNYESDNGTVIMNSSYPEYRRFQLTFYAEWLRHDFFEERAFVHDLLHTFYAPLFNFSNNLIDKMFDKGSPSRELLSISLEETNEGVTEDLADKLLFLMNNLEQTKQENVLLKKQLLEPAANKRKPNLPL